MDLGIDKELSSATLADSRRLTKNDARRSSALQLHIVDGFPVKSVLETARVIMSDRK